MVTVMLRMASPADGISFPFLFSPSVRPRRVIFCKGRLGGAILPRSENPDLGHPAALVETMRLCMLFRVSHTGRDSGFHPF
jgi:hypothetical protein